MVNCNNIRHEYLDYVIGVKMTVPVGYNYIPTDIPENVYGCMEHFLDGFYNQK